MTLLQDVRAAGPAALHLPGSLLHRGCGVTRDGPALGRRPPVVLVHGYAGTAAVWDPLVRQLLAAGFGHISRLSYNSWSSELPEVLTALGEAAATAVAETGAQGVHLVGHSLGGLLARCAVQSGLLPVHALTVVTIATPHAGSPLARLAPGPCARLLRPRSPLLPTRWTGGTATRWVAYWSDGDRVVPPASARLDVTGVDVTNVHVPRQGHLTICSDRGLLSSVVSELGRERPVPGADAAAGHSREAAAA
jgi:predicted alpha/beta hydrolase family esterase